MRKRGSRKFKKFQKSLKNSVKKCAKQCKAGTNGMDILDANNVLIEVAGASAAADLEACINDGSIKALGCPVIRADNPCTQDSFEAYIASTTIHHEVQLSSCNFDSVLVTGECHGAAGGEPAWVLCATI